MVVDFVRCWSEKTEIRAGRFIRWLGVRASKFYDWRERYGRVNEHNGWVPRDFWLAPWEKQAIIGFHQEHPLEGYRRLTFMMLDSDVVAVSPSSVWRVLQRAGLLSRWKGKPSRKGSGFEQPPHPHQHWHIDVSYINVSGTFYYLCSVLDGYSPVSYTHLDVYKRQDRTYPSGLGVNTRLLGWGVGFFDMDNDGWLDILMSNGHVYPEVDKSKACLLYTSRCV